MKTLVIHPTDKTTEFLKQIYEGKGFTVVNDRKSEEELIELVKSHDRIMMMGHGTPNGLIGYSHVFMNPAFISVLQTKDCVCIWCNADKYVMRHNIRGFYTGMIISEVLEAWLYQIDVEQPTVDESNQLFTEAMTKCLYEEDMVGVAKGIYITEDNPVIKFNQQRLYYRESNLIIENVK